MKMFASSKRGRPKRSAAANDNARDPGARDPGTQELQMKRASLAHGLDPVATAHPLDLLLARGLIDTPAHRAGWRYAGLYRRVIGRIDVSYGRFYDGLRGEGGRAACGADDAADLAVAQQHFRQAQSALRAAGPVVAGITERLVVFGVWPDWLPHPVPSAQRDLALLRRGLLRLAWAGRGAPVANAHTDLQVMP